MAIFTKKKTRMHKEFKYVVTTLAVLIIVLLVLLYLAPSTVVYSDQGRKIVYCGEDFDIHLLSSENLFDEIKPRGAAKSGGIDGVIPPILNIIFGLTTTVLEMKEQEYIGQYSLQKSNLNPIRNEIPDLEILRQVTIDSVQCDALEIDIKSKIIDPSVITGGFVYYVDNINLNYSAAKVTSRSKVLDYIIELELAVIDTTGVKSAIKAGPIVIPSVQFQSPDSLFKGMDAKYHSNVLQFPANGVLTDVGITIIETNPLKVRAQKILSLWKANQTDLRRIVDLIIKE